MVQSTVFLRKSADGNDLLKLKPTSRRRRRRRLCGLRSLCSCDCCALWFDFFSSVWSSLRGHSLDRAHVLAPVLFDAVVLQWTHLQLLTCASVSFVDFDLCTSDLSVDLVRSRRASRLYHSHSRVCEVSWLSRTLQVVVFWLLCLTFGASAAATNNQVETRDGLTNVRHHVGSGVPWSWKRR